MAARKSSKSQSPNFLQDHLMGITALVLALLSMVIASTSLALLAIGLGGLAVWGNFRSQNYQFIFLGVTAILIGIVTIWNYANLVAQAAY